MLSIYFRMFGCKLSITFDTYLLSCRYHCVDIFYIRLRFCETFTVTNLGAILLLIETPSNHRAIKYIPPSFTAFHIPLIFERSQLKISEICTLFQPLKLQIFCILTIVSNIAVDFYLQSFLNSVWSKYFECP